MKRRDFLKTLSAVGVGSLFAGCDSAKAGFFDIFLPIEEKKKLSIMIPLYSYPNWWDEENYKWKKLIDVKNNYPDIEIVAIVNPSNGDFDSQNSDFVHGIEDLVDADIKVVGYIYTKYGNRDISEVTRNLDAWQEYYQDIGVSGIFYDEVSTSDDDLEYYSNLSNEAKERGFDYIILNPGTTTDQKYIDSEIANLVVTYENSNSQLESNPPSKYNKPSQNCELSILVHQMDRDNLDDLIDFARDHDFSYIYFTEDGADGNPWDSVSKYLEDEVQKALE